MTPIDFVIWLKGFAQAANNFTLTPKQWDDIREQLDKVKVDNIKPYWTIEFDNKNSNNTNNIKND
jgi:hypothetical protein